MSSMENSVVPSNEIDAKQPANPESDEGRKQPEETRAEHVISISDRFGTLMGSDEEDEGPLIGQVTGDLGVKSKLNVSFQPRIMLIGPLQDDKNKLEQGQQFKRQQGHKNKLEKGPKNTLEQGQQFKRQLAKRFIKKNRQKKETIFNNILKEIESLKKCYDQELLKKFHRNDEDLAWMFFEDGCALIQLVSYWFDSEFYENIADDQMDLILTRDLLILNNQLPLGVLNLVMGFGKEGGELYQNDHSVGKQAKEFRHTICRFIKLIAMMNFKRWEKAVKADSVSFNDANHLLGLLWMNLVKKEKDSRSDNTKVTPLQFRSVKDLQAAGIKLEPNNSSSSLRDISFKRGFFFCKLKIPSFRLDEQGKFLVCNLIAFEMHPNFDKDRVVTSYISFLNSLMTTKEDVAELRKAGILCNYLPNDEAVLKTFQDFTSILKPYTDIFSNTKEELIEYFNDKKSMTTGEWLSEAMHVYFRSPWTTMAFVSATILLILTIIQTIFSVLAYQHR